LDQDTPISKERPPAPDAQRRIAEIAELAGGLAHELRNPLSTMMINLKLLAEDLGDPEADPEDVRRRALLKVDTLRGEAERLQGLFEDFLNLAGPCRLQRKETDLNAVVARLVEFFEPSARTGGIEVRISHADDPLMCSVDERLLSQALLNILINAQQAMPDGGELTITTGIEGDDVVVAVRDTGIGITESDRARIFRPFFSTKAGGNGLGLSITQRLVHEHGGELRFAGEPGRGTTFTMRLPRRPPAEGAERPRG
jgi:signal transduction histidine kinase